MITISVLVTGLAVIVPVSSDQVTVLLPKVERSYWEQCGSHIATHEAHLAFVCADWKWDRNARPEKRSLDKKICWIRLDDDVMELTGIPPQERASDPNIPLLMQRNMPRDGINQLRAIDWVPEMSEIDPEYKDLADSLREKHPGYLQARTTFAFTQWKSCGFEGIWGQDRERYAVPMYVFKNKRTDSSFGNRAQSLASGAVFEIEASVRRPIRLILAPLGDGTPLEMTLSNLTKPRVDLGLVQLVEDSESIQHAVYALLNNDREGRDSHFRVYYELSDRAPQCHLARRPAAVPVPFRTHWCRKVLANRLREACDSQILYDSPEEIMEDYTIENVISWLGLDDHRESERANRTVPQGNLLDSLSESLQEALKGGGGALRHDASSEIRTDGLFFPFISPIPIKAPPEYRLMNIFGPPLCTPIRMD